MTTTTAFRIAKAIYPILLERARAGRTITYGERAEQMKARHPKDEVIANVIPRSLGPRLLLLRQFTTEQGYPDLSSLVVNGRTGEVGEAYSDVLDAVGQRDRVMTFDWTSVLPEFDLFIDDRVRNLQAGGRHRRSRDEAKMMLWEYARSAGGRALPTPAQREAALLNMMSGASLETAIAEAVSMDPAST